MFRRVFLVLRRLVAAAVAVVVGAAVSTYRNVEITVREKSVVCKTSELVLNMPEEFASEKVKQLLDEKENLNGTGRGLLRAGVKRGKYRIPQMLPRKDV